jgi:predicted peptidase
MRASDPATNRTPALQRRTVKPRNPTPMRKFAALLGMCCALLVLGSAVGASANPADAKAASQAVAGGHRRQVEIRSTADKSLQPCFVITPDNLKPDRPTPLLVSLHTWSNGVEQRSESLETLAMEKGWIYLFPHFRGPNQHPDACASEIAQQDILDAVAWAKGNFVIDTSRVYLTGVSGGGHMTMQMVGRYPEKWTAASAWVGISDLAQWHAKQAETGYGEMMRKSCGGAPGTSAAVDQQYAQRSPLTWLHRAKDVPLDIAAGVHDGHTGSVPIWHSLAAYNKLAELHDAVLISNDEIQQLSRPNGRLNEPRESDKVKDASFGRDIHLRRHAGPSRVTIFEGGHEGISAAAVAWLAASPPRATK